MNFEELYNEHKSMVYNLALHYTQQTEDAQEITQDVFVAAYQSLAAFKEESSITTWLYRITINKSLDCIKAKKRKKRFGFMTSLFFIESTQKNLSTYLPTLVVYYLIISEKHFTYCYFFNKYNCSN